MHTKMSRGVAARVVLAALALVIVSKGCAVVAGGLAGAGTGYVAGHAAGERSAEKKIKESEK